MLQLDMACCTCLACGLLPLEGFIAFSQLITAAGGNSTVLMVTSPFLLVLLKQVGIRVFSSSEQNILHNYKCRARFVAVDLAVHSCSMC